VACTNGVGLNLGSKLLQVADGPSVRTAC
jgi:hypothetical protein